MKNRKGLIEDSYLPVAWEYRESIQEAIEQKKDGKIFFFNPHNEVDEVQGQSLKIEGDTKLGDFLVTYSGERIRIDRIITLYGKVGAAYDEYNAFADACMDCLGGYDKDEIG
ncbi:MAG: hypothetical protein ACTJFN_11950 [Sphingobacterium sp.]